MKIFLIGLMLLTSIAGFAKDNDDGFVTLQVFSDSVLEIQAKKDFNIQTNQTILAVEAIYQVGCNIDYRSDVEINDRGVVEGFAECSLLGNLCKRTISCFGKNKNVDVNFYFKSNEGSFGSLYKTTIKVK